MLQNEPTFWTSEAGKSHTANRNNCKLKNNSPPRHFHSQQNRKRRRCETLLPSCRQPNWKCSEPPFMGDTLTTSISLSLSKHLFFLALNCTDVCGITRSETNAFSLSLSSLWRHGSGVFVPSCRLRVVEGRGSVVFDDVKKWKSVCLVVLKMRRRPLLRYRLQRRRLRKTDGRPEAGRNAAGADWRAYARLSTAEPTNRAARS